MESVTFNGVVLTDSYHVFARRGMPYQTAQTEAVPGRDGVLVLGADYTPPSLSLVFVLGPCGQAEMMQRIRALAAVLDVREPRPLYLGDDGGLYYMAMPSGERDWVRHPRSGTVEVPFLVRDAAMYGEERSFIIPGNGPATVEIGGTYPTGLYVNNVQVRPDSSSQLYRIVVDDEYKFEFKYTSAQTVVVTFDMDSRILELGGSAALPTLDSTWLVLAPGTHTVEKTLGSPGMSVKYRERWL